MGLVTSERVLNEARKGKYAICGFNIHNLETLQAVIEGAERAKSPLIIQTTPGTVQYAGIKNLVSLTNIAAEQTAIPVILHLDHGRDPELIKTAIDQGYTSVMIDGSYLQYTDNVLITREIVRYAHQKGVVVEAELGTLGGREDGITVDGKGSFTDPQLAKDFVEKTGIDSLAVAIGTAHGHYKGQPALDFNRLKEIFELVQIPLVLHGASGLTAESIKKAVKTGISKVNIATDIKDVFVKGIKEYLDEFPEENDPRKYFKAAKERVSETVICMARITGSYHII